MLWYSCYIGVLFVGVLVVWVVGLLLVNRLGRDWLGMFGYFFVLGDS